MSQWYVHIVTQKSVYDRKLGFQTSKNMQKTLFKPKPLSVPFVFSHLKEIALSAGHSVIHDFTSVLSLL